MTMNSVFRKGSFNLYRVFPNQNLMWNFYTTNISIYLKNNFQQTFKNSNIDQIKQSIDPDYRVKAQDPTRYFLIFKHKVTSIGLANVYITQCEKTPLKTLNIAEFYIFPEYRRKKYGSHFSNTLKAWGKTCSTTYLQAEVNKDNHQANAFWKEQQLELDISSDRNIYKTKIQKN